MTKFYLDSETGSPIPDSAHDDPSHWFKAKRLMSIMQTKFTNFIDRPTKALSKSKFIVAICKDIVRKAGNDDNPPIIILM
jgi:hypothetical protein